jgi:hypothetical protein
MPLEPSTQDRAALIALEESLWRAETRFDLDYMERTLAPDFFEFGRSGRAYTRAQVLGVPFEPFDAFLNNFDVRLIDTNVALVTYVSEVVYGNAKEIGNRSSLWTRDKGRWQIRFHQGTPTA